MKKILLACLLLSHLGFSYELEVGKGSKSYNYNEYSDSGVLLDSELADLGALSLLYVQLAFKKSEALNLEFYYDYGAGYTKYIGSLLSGGAYGSVVSQTVNYFKTLQMAAMYKLYDFNDGSLRLLIHGGRYVWDRILSVAQKEIYHWYYIDLGFAFSQSIGAKLGWGVDAYFRNSISPKMDIDAPSLVSYTVLDLGATQGRYVKLFMRYDVSQELYVKASYIYETFEIGQSNVVNGYLEPRSTQVNHHAFVAVGLDFP